ncbi:MAG: hypothetical protein CME62_04545 [Halobacteriovoraceae bacterium]|nr:hypothetical protein [Halobacteriovoraceae bacterium]|tara:strand:- start:11285 stop:12091 length:807 start_codon:yes stop_codon:yes gene_type:complete
MVDTQNKTPLFNYYAPQNKYIGLISIPHSGLEKPHEFDEFLTQDEVALKQDVDFFVHELVDIPKLQARGIAVIKSNIIRTCVDLNRSPETCVLNWKQNSRQVPVVTQEPDELKATELRAKFYGPYYEMLKALIFELINKNPPGNIVDLHSMPSRATAYHMQQKPDQREQRPDFCLSDQFGASCVPAFIQNIQTALAEKYSEVFINDPYKGGYITQYIHENFAGVNNIQIEISRALYMDEEQFSLKPEHAELKDHLTKSLIALFEKFEV